MLGIVRHVAIRYCISPLDADDICLLNLGWFLSSLHFNALPLILQLDLSIKLDELVGDAVWRRGTSWLAPFCALSGACGLESLVLIGFSGLS